MLSRRSLLRLSTTALSSSAILGMARREANRQLAQTAPSNPLLTEIRNNPALVFSTSGLTPDPWQAELIRCEAKRIAVLCTRRAGKSRTTAARVLARCLTRSRYKSLVFSPTEDQSKEFLNYVREMNADLGCPVPLIRESMTELAWSNGSLVKAKPDSPRGSRGFTPDLVVVDEGAQVSDELFLSINPMMVLGKAEMMILSTPFGKLGWFFDIWDSPAKLSYWTQFRVTAEQCPRIDHAILEEHRATMPPRWFDQEYNCVFNDAVDAVFGKMVIESAVKNLPEFLPLELGV